MILHLQGFLSKENIDQFVNCIYFYKISFKTHYSHQAVNNNSLLLYCFQFFFDLQFKF